MEVYQNKTRLPFQVRPGRLERLVPLALGIHGTVMLIYRGGEPWQWAAIISVALVGLLFGECRRGDVILFRAGFILASAWFLMLSSGGTGSFFLLWYFVLASIYPLRLQSRYGLVLPIILSGGYLLLLPFSAPAIPLVVVLARTFLLLFIGLLTYFLGATMSQLFATEQHWAKEARTLQEAGAIVAATLDQDEAIERILQQLARVVPYDSASVQLLRQGYLEIVGGRGWPDAAAVVGLRFPVPGDNPNTVVIQQGQPHILGDAGGAHPTFRQEPHSHIRSWLGAPLVVQERVIGMLAIDSAQPNHFTPDHARLAAAFADQVAIAIENARLYTRLARSEARYRTLVEQASDGIFITDPEGNYIAVNPCGCRMLGYSREEILRLNVSDLVAAEDLATAPLGLDELRAGKTLVTERRLKRKDGALLHVEISAKMLPDGNLQGIVRDITGRKRAGELLAKLSRVVEQTADMVMITDKQGVTEYVNPAFAAFTGYSGAEAIGKTPAILKSGRHEAPFYDNLWRTILSGRVYRDVLVNKKKDGQLFYEEKTITPLRDGRGNITHFVSTGKDITERMQYEVELEQRVAERTQELAAANERLQELDKLKSKIVADVSHELRTPVSNLNLYVDLLQHAAPEKHQKYLAVLKKQADRLRQLVEDILDLSRLEIGRERVRFESLLLNELVEQVVIAHLPRAEEAGLELSFVPDATLPPILGECNQLAQAAANLVANAINYTPTGAVQVSTYLAREREQVCLQVKDTGIGIKPEDRPHLYERFYRGHHNGHKAPGSGLGLAIVKEIVDMHGGRIEMDSEAGVGTTFRVWLPLGVTGEESGEVGKIS